MLNRLSAFIGDDNGPWRVTRIDALCGEPLPTVQRIAVVTGAKALAQQSWLLRGVTSNERYVGTEEKQKLLAVQEGLGRTQATMAALIPIRKSAAWWLLSQQERREILEERSHHIQIGMAYLPAIARRLFHCRDLGIPAANGEPFDFLTWFEFAPGDTPRFDDLLAELRGTLEWTFVERETEIRLVRIAD